MASDRVHSVRRSLDLSNALEDQPIQDVFQRGCAVSNDPSTESDPINIVLCGIKKYECLNPVDDTEPKHLEIRYEYDLVYNQDADFNVVLPYLEELVLDYMATGFGKTDCATSGRRRKRRLAISSSEQALVQGVSSEPSDALDTTVDECITPTVKTNGSNTCKPIRGGLTLLLPHELSISAQQKNQLRKSTLSYLRTAMKGNLFVVPGVIDNVVFVANRTIPAVATDGDQDASKNNTASKPKYNTSGTESAASADGGRAFSPIGIGIVAAVAGLLVLSMLLFFATKKRYAQKSQSTFIDPDDEDEREWRKRGRGSDGAESALAVHDSLALQPQIIPDVDDPSEIECFSTADGSVKVSPSPPRASSSTPLPTTQFSAAERYFGYDERTMPRRLPFTQPKHSVPVSAYVDGDVIGELSSDDSSLVYNYEDDLSSSDCTPRDVLQMS